MSFFLFSNGFMTASQRQSLTAVSGKNSVKTAKGHSHIRNGKFSETFIFALCAKTVRTLRKTAEMELRNRRSGNAVLAVSQRDNASGVAAFRPRRFKKPMKQTSAPTKRQY